MVQEQRDPRPYELMTVIIPDMPEEDTASAVERLLGYITAQDGQITNNSTESPWGRRRLAYSMRFQDTDYRDGYYVLTHFSARPATIGEIERELKLDTQVIRYLLVSDDPLVGERNKPTEEAGSDEEAPAEEQIAEVADQIEGEENPAPADAPIAEAPAEEQVEATAPKRSSKLPETGEGTEWVAGDGTDTIPEGFPLKATTSSKIYHPSESPNYNNTTAEIYFATPEAAEQHGYRLPKVLQNAGVATAAAADEAAAAPEEE